ncbi:transporter [Candidatus Vecturithrix granuli]|uniref:Transporter n=1 Tax=Vecturithrix granuli TaxID=1499967 RepID=A0A081CAZ4_VECG1|nr:transporter [Candidatus Vecturithrix granuli]
MTIKAMQKVADLLVYSNIGYDQSQRWTFLDKKNKRIVKNGECDCSTSSGAIAWLGGYPVDLSGTFYTGNFAKRLAAAGFIVIPFKSLSQVKAGDFLLTPGRHVVFARTAKKFFSAEVDERGRSAGGKAGNQNARETRYRLAYVRPGGWRYIVRPVPAVTYKGRSLKYFSTKSSKFSEAMRMLTYTAPFDGPLYNEFYNVWTVRNKGMQHIYDATAVAVPQESHAFVVLGSALNTDGSLRSKYKRRLDLAVTALNSNPNSVVIVSGGAARNGKTEAEVGMTYLVNAGIDGKRIILEEASNSTVGNAKYSVPLMLKKGFESYTLISDASHLRRAAMLFDAAKLRIETDSNRRFTLQLVNTVAFKDSDSTEKPVASDALFEIGKEVAYLLGISAQFNAAK